MPEPRVRVFVKRRLRLDLLNYDQQQMYKLGVMGVDEVVERTSKAKNADDQPSKPLQRGYAIYKTRRGLSNRRNLTFSGDMLRNLSVRSVSRNFAKAEWTKKDPRKKALANNQIEEFAAFSPRNQQRLADAANQIMTREKIPFFIIERAFNV